MNKEYINKTIPIPVHMLPDYENQLELREKHETLLTMLLRFDEYCRRNDIKYSLADGTLIGAMRHGDFVPWDDDADLMMTREEYNKLRKCIKKDRNIKLFKIGCMDRVSFEENIRNNLYMDLFVIDKVPLSKLKYKILKLKCGFLRCYFLNIYQLGNSSHKEQYRHYLEPVLYWAANIYIGKRDVFDLYDSLFNKTDLKAKRYTKFTSTMDSMKKQYALDTFDTGYGNILFRGKTLMAIKKADDFLKSLYGDYLNLPSEEKRVVAHEIDMLQAPKNCIKWYS